MGWFIIYKRQTFNFLYVGQAKTVDLKGFFCLYNGKKCRNKVLKDM